MNATPELIAIVAVGAALFGFLWRLSRDVARVERELRRDMHAMGERLYREIRNGDERLRREIHDGDERSHVEIRGLGERVARLEGAVETNNALLRTLAAARPPEAAD